MKSSPAFASPLVTSDLKPGAHHQHKAPTLLMLSKRINPDPFAPARCVQPGGTHTYPAPCHQPAPAAPETSIKPSKGRTLTCSAPGTREEMLDQQPRGSALQPAQSAGLGKRSTPLQISPILACVSINGLCPVTNCILITSC